MRTYVNKDETEINVYKRPKKHQCQTPHQTPVSFTYKALNKIVKQEIKVFKKKKLEHKIQLMEQDFHQNNSYNLFKTVKGFEGIPKKTIHAVIDKQGKKLTDINSVLKYWKERVQEHLKK